MSGLKKLRLLLIPILVSGAVSQAADATALSQQARARGGCYVELEPFLARSTDSLLTTLPFAVTVVTSISDFTRVDYYFDKKWQWGFRAAAGYDFPSCSSCNYGFSLEYTWHRSDQDKSLENVISPTFTPSAFPITSVIEFFPGGTTALANYDFRYHAIDLLAHQNSTFCNCVDVQFFGGFRYVRLREDLSSHFFVTEQFVQDVISSFGFVNDFSNNLESKFEGIGPRLGVNVFYNITNNVGLVTEFAGNLIFGTSENNYFELILTDGPEVDITRSSDNHEDKRGLVVPALSGKVGLAYRASLCNCSTLAVELGIRGDKYFDIANHSSYVGPTQFDLRGVRDGSYHDFDIFGPYLSVSYHL